MSGPPLEAFRAALRPLHDRIERTVDLISDSVDQSRYDRFLGRSYGFIRACEERLDLTAAPQALQLPARLRNEALALDLWNRGIDAATLERAALTPALSVERLAALPPNELLDPAKTIGPATAPVTIVVFAVALSRIATCHAMSSMRSWRCWLKGFRAAMVAAADTCIATASTARS